MKTKFSSLDVRCMTHNLQHLCGLRISNIYDLSGKSYILKFAAQNGKKFLLLESGLRFHSTEFQRDKNSLPSGFSVKLRKHLRGKRLESVKQMGIDRVVDFTFGTLESECHIILELYAGGNIILTDKDYSILSLLRSHKFDESVRCAVHEKYPFNHSAGISFENVDDSEENIRKMASQSTTFSDKGKKDKGKNMKQLLASVATYMHMPFAEHCLRAIGADPSKKIDIENEDYIPLIVKAVAQGAEEIKNLDAMKIIQGFITYEERKTDLSKTSKTAEEDSKDAQSGEKAQPLSASRLYQEFTPLIFKQHESMLKESFDCFEKATDLYFSHMETQKFENRLHAKEKEIWKKKERIERDQQNRIDSLQNEQVACWKKAQLLEYHQKEVDQVRDVLNKSLETGVDWQELNRMIKEERKKGNPLANLIESLQLDKNQATILLEYPDDFDEFNANEEPLMRVEIDLGRSAFLNAQNYFQTKKKSAIKEVKTREAADQAIKQAEKHANKEILTEVVAKVGIKKIRKVYWFEKFNWFISSQNYLIISGRDMQQNEILVKKYMKKGDIYIHADLHGASTTLIKNPSGQPIPPITLEEAGMMTICRSQAWNSKVVTSAYWVYHDQVSKTAPSGEYLPTGSFMIRGKKNFLNPTKLEMGLTLLFRLDESSLAEHLNERKHGEGQNTPSADTSFDTVEMQSETSAMSAPLLNTESNKVTDTRVAMSEEEKEKPSTLDAKMESSECEDLSISPREDLREEVKEAEEEHEEEDEDIAEGGKQSGGQEALEEEEEDHREMIPGTESGTKSGKKRMNAAEKRKLKKAKKREGRESDDDNEKEAEEEEKAANGDDERQDQQSKTTSKRKKAKGGKPADEDDENDDSDLPMNVGLLPRGKRNKMKRMQKKYGDQDWEEQEMKIKMLGTDQVKELKTKNVKESSDNDEIQEEVKEKPRQPKPSSLRKEKKEIEKILGEENLMTEEELSQLNEIDFLTGHPKKDDLFHFAVPMCAPYISMKNYKYKIKILPGSMKKGKAIKEIVNLYSNHSDILAGEKEAIRLINETEYSGALLSGIKLAVSGANRKANQKGQQKRKKK
mmetsp:Transcript_45288/g.52061  ORF Transcript_45288/g.52061 Transcript_45288/m.52061 type:complete len:1080 (-) Transcript_45288:383-3622(-)